MSSSSLKTFADQIRQAENSGKIEINASSKRAILGLLAEYEGAVGNFDADPGTYALALLALLHSDMEDKIRDAEDGAGDAADEIEDAIDRLEETARQLKKFSRGGK